MDIVKFDIVLSRHPPRRIGTPTSSSAPISDAVTINSVTVPSLDESKSPSPSEQSTSSVGDLKVPATITSGVDSSLQHYDPPLASSAPPSLKLPALGTVSQPTTLGDRFHDWMEMDLEHGL